MMTIPAFIIDHQLDQDTDERGIKRAYAKALKQIDQEHDLEGFQSLRESYESALNWVRNKAWHEAQVAQEIVGNEEVDEAPESSVSSEPIRCDATDIEAKDKQGSHDSLPLLETSTPVIYTVDIARELFAELMTQIGAQDKEKIANAGQTETILRHMLDDVRMINVEIRDMFEWMVAEHVAQGWQAGNVDLFGAAVKCFQWNQDKNRLLRFDGFGYYLDRALVEMSAFNLQEQHRGNRQVTLIRLARDNAPPTKQFLRENVAFVNELLSMYPTWLSLVTNIDNLKEWSRRSEEYKFFQAPKPNYDSENESSWGNWTWAVIMLLLVLGRVLGSTAK